MGIIDSVKGLWALRGLVAEAKKEITVNNEIKPGWKTSEFWLHIASQLPTVLGLFLGASNPIVIALTAAGALAASVYTLSRSNLKGAALSAAASDAAKAASDSLTKAAADAPKAEAPKP